MSSFLTIQFPGRPLLRPITAFALAYILFAMLALNNYLSFFSLNLLLGVLTLSFVFRLRPYREGGYRFAWIMAILMLLCFLMPVKTLLYFTLCAALLFLIEFFYGKQTGLAALSLLLMSPVFQYAVNTFSFPIRLWLTRLAGDMLSLASMENTVAGNVITHRGSEFSVDAGCMGLQMMEASLLLGIMLIAFFQSQNNKRVTGWKLLVYFGVIASLNIVCNLFRIILLVQFNLPPETVGHEMAGIACLLVYVFIPAIWLARKLVKNGIVKPETILPDRIFSLKHRLFHLLVLFCLLLLAFRVGEKNTYARFSNAGITKCGEYAVSAYQPGILKLESNDALVYLKYIRGFFDTDHSPLLCWTGSGYQFDQLQKEHIAGSVIFTGRLIKSNDKLYTAWWYDNGIRQTVDPWVWRWDNIRSGADYAVVNVTSTTRQMLFSKVAEIIKDRKLSPLMGNNK